MTKRKTFLIIDANSVVHRAYHALPNLSDQTGSPAQAVYGFALAFIHIAKTLNPDYVAACFDTKKPTFRHKQFHEYKIQRPATPPDLIEQFPKVIDLLSGFGVPVFMQEGYEADDLIATIAIKTKTLDQNCDIYILTGDYDTLQLVDDRVRVYLVTRGVKNAVIYSASEVYKKFGIGPNQIADFKALAGDPSDNIPGAVGIGKNTAIQLLKRFGSIKGVYDAIEKTPQDFLSLRNGLAVRRILANNKEQILLFENLTKLNTDVPFDFEPDNCKFNHLQGNEPIEILQKFGFVSLAKRLVNTADCSAITPSLF